MTVIVHPCCGKTWASERVTWAEPPRGKKRSPIRTRRGEDDGDSVWLIKTSSPAKAAWPPWRKTAFAGGHTIMQVE
jgi:hypothetical protein